MGIDSAVCGCAARRGRMAGIAAVMALALSSVAGHTMAGTAEADEDATQVQARVSAADFAELRRLIDREMRTDKRYRELTEDDYHAVHEALDEMEAILGGADSIDALDADRRAVLFNAQERANGLLTGAREDSRTECRRETRVGTRVPVTTCHTVAQWRRQGGEARESLLRHSRGPRGDPDEIRPAPRPGFGGGG